MFDNVLLEKNQSFILMYKILEITLYYNVNVILYFNCIGPML